MGNNDDKGEKHDKVLHTRISPSLDREIKRRARGLGMSVSTVVRNVLLHTFDLVEDIVNDSANIALSIAGDDSEGSARDDASAASEILGWQQLVLNMNAVCDRCNAILAKGTDAAIAVRDRPGPRTLICESCLSRVGTDDG